MITILVEGSICEEKHSSLVLTNTNQLKLIGSNTQLQGDIKIDKIWFSTDRFCFDHDRNFF
ncbi:MAG: hypothetical protein UZ09_BCD002001356 [Bacteroidetes bacterium OLB9]|nr:MAG: hypothetical protein UZ09_BCD002001356 [Bacteroidetes bacterium OLB9]